MATAPPILDDNPIEADPNLPGPGQPAPVHTILDDIANAVRDYPKNYVDLEFADVDPEVGTSINTNEEANFRIRVVNRGPLTLRDVKIRVVAKSGAKVKGNGAIDPLDGEAFANTLDVVGGHNTDNPDETTLMTLKAPAATKPAGTDLLEAYIDEFDADWQHTLLSHSRLVTERLGLYEAQVHAQ